eukprot:4162674-Amphidinium_carterae.1
MGGAIITPAAVTANAASSGRAEGSTDRAANTSTGRAEGSTERQADGAASTKVKKAELHPEEEVPDDIPEEGEQDVEGAEPRPEKRARGRPRKR